MVRKTETDESPSAAAKPKQASAKTVKMVRDQPMHEGGPTEADVHPDEVENWTAAGWRKSA